jgi:hypothetical protein
MGGGVAEVLEAKEKIAQRKSKEQNPKEVEYFHEKRKRSWKEAIKIRDERTKS